MMTSHSTKDAVRESRQEFIAKLTTLELRSNVRIGALLLHGLTGMPNEMRPVARALEALGCQVRVPMLPGHGAGQKELLATGWKDWLQGSRLVLEELCKTCDYVVVGGLSMGSLLAIPLAVDNPKVVGLVAMSPTIKYDSNNSSNPFQVLLPLVDFAPFLGKSFYWTEAPPFGLKDERLQRLIVKQLDALKKSNKEASASSFDFHPEQFRTYAGSLRQLQKMVKQVEKQARDVKCPVLIMQSLEDTITTKWNAETYYKWLGTKDKRLIFLEGCDHVLPMDLKKEEVIYHFAEFVCKVAAKLAPSEQAVA